MTFPKSLSLSYPFPSKRGEEAERQKNEGRQLCDYLRARVTRFFFGERERRKRDDEKKKRSLFSTVRVSRSKRLERAEYLGAGQIAANDDSDA